MKNLFLIIAAFIFIGSFATAQDIIKLKSGTILEVKITKIGKDKIEFRPFVSHEDEAVIEIDRYLVKSYEFEFQSEISEVAELATNINIEDLYDNSPRFAIKTQPVQAILMNNFKVSVEQNLSFNRSLEIEAGLNVTPFLFDLDEIPTAINLTARYKNFARKSSTKMTDSGANPLQGFYYAPVVSLGNSTNWENDFEDLSNFGSNLFLTGMVDVGHQFTINNFIGDVFIGVGLSLNTKNREGSYNNSHFSYSVMAFRMGYRMGLQFEK